MASLSHPDVEFTVVAAGEGEQAVAVAKYCETWVYQIQGDAVLCVGEASVTLGQGCCCVLAPGEGARVQRGKGSVGILVRQRPNGRDSA